MDLQSQTENLQSQTENDTMEQNEIGGEMDIDDWREKIDHLDEQIVKLVSERAAAASAIGALKQKSLLPVYEPKREQAVFDHVRKVNPGPLPDQEMQHVFERIMDVMRSLQRRG